MNGFDLITQGPRAFGVAALIALASPPAAQDRQDTTFIITEGDEIGRVPQDSRRFKTRQ